MIPDWPPGLPRPERGGWQIEEQEARRRRQGDTGPPGYRRRHSAVARQVAMSLMLDRDQHAIFDTFRRVTCAEGALRFRMPDPATDGWPLLGADGSPLMAAGGVPVLLSARWLCAWGDRLPAETVQGTMFRKDFTLWVLP